MKKEKSKQSEDEDRETRPEYDFEHMGGGVRGKYYKAYREGHTVTVQHEDGSSTAQHFTLEEGAVMLEPDVKEYFPDSEAVNKALRGLIALIPSREGMVSRKN
jgi:hypothetical protein